MERKHIVGGVLAVVVLLAAVVGAVVTGFGPAPGGTGSGDDIEQFPTETTTAGTGDDSGGADDENRTTTSAEQPPFAFDIVRIDQCGQTCRNVTATIYNNQNHTAESVTVYTRIYVGNSTAESDVVWEGKEAVGTMAPNSSYTSSRRVELTYSEAYEVKQHGGWITIVTTVQSENVTITFEDQRDVT